LRGVYVGAQVIPTHRVWVQAALLLAPPGSFAAHHTAATLLGATAPETPTLHIGTSLGRTTKHRRVRLHRYAVMPPLVMVAGLACTTAVRTFLDMAAQLELVELVVLGDSLVRAGRTTVRELVDAARASSGSGARLAREAAGYVRPRVDSPMETRVRMLLVLAGLPEPDVNVEVRLHGGCLVYRIDLAYPGVKVAIEYDGRHHIDRQAQWQQDLRRREDLESAGWRFVVLTSHDVFGVPAETLERVNGVLREAGMPVGRLRSDWMRFFPARAGISA
jgi:hypothetical protein